MRGKDLARLLLLMRRRGGGLTYLLRDLFTTDEAAPLTSPRTCEPGPGTLTITDLDSVLSITGGELSKAAGGTSGYQRCGIIVEDIVNSVGDVVAAKFNMASVGIFFPVAIENSALNGSSSALDLGFRISTPYFITQSKNGGGSSGGIGVFPFAVNTDYATAVIRRSSGGFFVINGKLVWVVGIALDAGTNEALFAHCYTNTVEHTMDNFTVLSLPANGYTAWDADFSTVTDSKTAPVSNTAINCGADAHIRINFTYEAGKEVSVKFRYVASADAVMWRAKTDGTFQLYDLATASTLVAVAGAFSDGVAYQVDIIFQGTTIRAFLNNDQQGSDATNSTNQLVAQARVEHNLAANDIVLTTHPYPALGIATDRVICPQLNDAFTHEPDFLLYARGVTLGADVDSIIIRKADATNRILCHIYATGAILLTQQISGSYNSRITTAAGTISSGDDLCLVMEGANAQIFVNGASVGSSSAVVDTDATSGHFAINDGMTIDSIEIFPRDVTSLLPSELV